MIHLQNKSSMQAVIKREFTECTFQQVAAYKVASYITFVSHTYVAPMVLRLRNSGGNM